MKLSKHLLATAVAGALVGIASAAPYPHGPVSGNDVGPAAAYAENAQVSVTVALKLRNADQMEQLIESVYTRGSPQYRQFLSTEQFKNLFGPAPETIAAVTKEFEAQGLSVTQSATAQLHVTGTAAQIEKAFAVQLHSFEVPASASTSSYRYRAPLSAPKVPDAIAGSVRAVLGLDTRPRLTPHLRAALHPAVQSAQKVSGAPNTPDAPGLWTVVDFADYYDVNPLYQQGLTGRGGTLAILTFAAFTPSDAFAYWSALGLKVNPNRLQIVNIDGGPGAPSDESGSVETTIDVEQSGGLAPGADILLYQGPNTNQAFVDTFAAAIDSNRADSVSVSWGEWEGFDGSNPVIGNGLLTNPNTGQQQFTLQILDDLLAQAALQGQSFFCAAGDSGAYDTADELPGAPSAGQPYSYNTPLSVDDPAVQRFITTGGGTTLPGTQVYSGGPLPAPITINIPTEQAWNWEYLAPLCVEAFDAPPNCEFSVGTGGGVSIYVQRPFYQWGVPGMANTVAGQQLDQLTPAPAQELYALPAHFAGRNVPDISANADPQTGYQVYYTSNVTGFGIQQYGGTSFVGPQMNGVTSLFRQAMHQRVGLLTPELYWIATSPQAYHGRNAPFRDITQSNNWYWQARPGYDQTTGVGVPNVANLLEALEDLQF
jgi:kumamolisin